MPKPYELWLALVGMAGFVAPLPPQPTGQLAVSLRLDRGKQGLAPAEGAVIWFPGVPDNHPAAERPAVRQREKQFVPHVVVVRRGAVVEFPNDDRIYHNVFSQSPGASFDLGLFRDGASRSVRFDRPGLVRVFCNIHAQMASNIMVLGDVAFAIADASGVARFDGLPPGRHEIRIWHEMAGERSAEVVISPPGPGRLDMELKMVGLPQPHKNKFGQDYPKTGRDVDRY